MAAHPLLTGEGYGASSSVCSGGGAVDPEMWAVAQRRHRFPWTEPVDSPQTSHLERSGRSGGRYRPPGSGPRSSSPGFGRYSAWSSKPPQPSGSLVTLQSRAATPRSAIAGQQGRQGRAEFCIPGFDPGLPGWAFRYTDRQSIRSLKSRCAANERCWFRLAASKALLAASVSVANWRTGDLGFCAWGA